MFDDISVWNRSREDTVRCIVASLTDEGNNELVNELVKTKPTGEEEEEEDTGSNWEEWMPDPVDADPCMTVFFAYSPIKYSFTYFCISIFNYL